MPNIIRHGKIVTDNWLTVDAAGGARFAATVDPLPERDLLVSIATWRTHRAQLLAYASLVAVRLGVRVEGHIDPAELAPDLQHFALIAVHFAQTGDGRGYSLARLLRERFDYRGELRAVGEVLRDNLFYLAQCGFDAFELAATADLEAALASLEDFSETYQTSAAQPQPLFRRRLAEARA